MPRPVQPRDGATRSAAWLRAIVALAFLLVVGAAASVATATTLGVVIRVPQDHPTIQAGADAAAGRAGIVLVDAGVWAEEVNLDERHTGITIRGVDRNTVVLDGEGRRATAILVRGADDVRLENMTAHDYVAHGFSWQSVDGYVGRYLTAYRIGVYGIYAFDSTRGLIEASYSSGASDAAFYIGQCNPCDATVRNVTGAYATMGYSGTNASGNIAVEDSQWFGNGAGIVPNSLDSEALPPQRTAIIRRNVVQDSGRFGSPSRVGALTIDGIGILVGGGIDDIVEDNLITGSRRIGIGIAPQASQTLWPAQGNQVRRNIVRDTADDGVDLAITAEPDSGNCFADNQFATSDPADIEGQWPCDADAASAAGHASSQRAVVPAPGACSEEPGGCGQFTSWEQTPIPLAQATMPESEAGQGVAGGPDPVGGRPAPSPSSTPDPASTPAATSPLPMDVPVETVVDDGFAQGPALVGGGLLVVAVVGWQARRRNQGTS